MNKILQQRIEEAAHEFDKEGLRVIFENGANFILSHLWISVEEALPECDRCHLAMYEDGGIIVAKYENKTWWWQDGFVIGKNTEGDLMYSSSCKVPSSLITHWMMIPTINNEEK